MVASKRPGGGPPKTLFLFLNFVAVLVVTLCLPLSALGQISEAKIIELARSLPEVAASNHNAAAVKAKLIGAGLYPNPSVEWEREAMDVEREDVVKLALPLDFSSRRTTRELLVGAELDAANASVMRTRTEVVSGVLTLFYELVARQERREIERRAVDRLQEAARVIGKRVQEGSASGYDLTRIEIEAQVAESELRQTEARLKREERELSVLLAIAEPQSSFSGSLSLNPQSSPNSASQPKSLDLWRAANAKAQQARDASSFSWLPTLSLEGGLRIAEASETRYGYVAGVSIDVPLFSNGQDLRAEADAHRDYSLSLLAVAERRAAVATARAESDLRTAGAEAQRFENATRERIVALERAVESGYREGQRSIVELLDARRARTIVELRGLSLSLSAKKAEIALRAARGEFE